MHIKLFGLVSNLFEYSLVLCLAHSGQLILNYYVYKSEKLLIRL